MMSKKPESPAMCVELPIHPSGSFSRLMIVINILNEVEL